MKAFSPAEAKDSHVHSIPDEVIESVNELLSERYSSRIVLMQNEIMDRIQQKFKAAGKKYSRQQVFDNHWMDFEPVFRKEGWRVDYDKPGYCESYEANFTFSEKR